MRSPKISGFSSFVVSFKIIMHFHIDSDCFYSLNCKTAAFIIKTVRNYCPSAIITIIELLLGIFQFIFIYKEIKNLTYIHNIIAIVLK